MSSCNFFSWTTLTYIYIYIRIHLIYLELHDASALVVLRPLTFSFFTWWQFMIWYMNDKIVCFLNIFNLNVYILQNRNMSLEIKSDNANIPFCISKVCFVKMNTANFAMGFCFPAWFSHKTSPFSFQQFVLWKPVKTVSFTFSTLASFDTTIFRHDFSWAVSTLLSIHQR